MNQDYLNDYDHSNIITNDPYVVMNIYYQFYLAIYYSFYKLFYLGINYINRASHYPYVFSLPCFPVHELLSSDFIKQLSGILHVLMHGQSISYQIKQTNSLN